MNFELFFDQVIQEFKETLNLILCYSSEYPYFLTIF